MISMRFSVKKANGQNQIFSPFGRSLTSHIPKRGRAEIRMILLTLYLVLMVHAKISMARLCAPTTFKFSEVVSFVVKDNSYYALPSASTANENRLFLTTSTGRN
jgi:hypothetical protein